MYLYKNIDSLPSTVYEIYNPKDLCLVTRLILSHLKKHIFNCNFENYINLLSSLDIESTLHFSYTISIKKVFTKMRNQN